MTDKVIELPTPGGVRWLVISQTQYEMMVNLEPGCVSQAVVRAFVSKELAEEYASTAWFQPLAGMVPGDVVNLNERNPDE